MTPPTSQTTPLRGPVRPIRTMGTPRRSSGGRPVQILLTALALSGAVILQNVVFSHLARDGVVPDVVLLVVVAVGLVRGAQSGMVTGFAGGLLLDLVPPADHVAGRWALALMIVGYVAGRLRQEAAPGVGAVLATVAACSFLGTSVFALTGLVLQGGSNGTASIPDLLGVVLVGVAWDVVLTVVVLLVAFSPIGRLVRRLRLRTTA